MPFNQKTITKYRKKWFHFKPRTGSPTISHFDEVGTSPIPIRIPIDLDHPSVEYPDVVENDSIQYNETSTNIFSLPPELLATIFLYCITMRQSTVFDRNRAPISLTQTCQVWRDVAVGTPQLWNRLFPSSETPIDMIQTWLSRARHSPLVLDFTGMNFGTLGNCALPGQEAIFRILSSHLSSAAELSFSERIPSSIILCKEAADFPQLQRVRWFFSDHSAADPVTNKSFEHFWSIASSIPSLQNIAINQIPPVGPWSQLTELQLLGAPVYNTFQILPQCTRLRRLNWTINRTTSGITFFSPIVIPTLHHLSLNFHDKLDQRPILDCLTLPHIHHFGISIPRSHSTMLKSLVRLLHRSSAKLQSFESNGVHSDGQASLLPFFKDPCFNTLRRVVIENGNMLEIVWAAFSEATFLPSLEDLQLSVHRDLDLDNVVSYLQTRQLQGSHLARVVFFVYCVCDMEVRKRNTLYVGCKELHPPWNTVQHTPSLGIQAIPWGFRSCFRSGDVHNL